MLFRKVFVLLAAAVPAAFALICGKTYEQCGGTFFQFSECCSTVSTCVKMNDYYSQCRPLPVNATGKADVYQQCGGVDFNGTSQCVEIANCYFYDQFYSQCLPAPEVDPANATGIQRPNPCDAKSSSNVTGVPPASNYTFAPTMAPTGAPMNETEAPTNATRVRWRLF